MNWSKIKTVFIIALLLVNLVIIRLIYTDSSKKISDSKLEQNALLLLKKDGINFDLDKKILTTKVVNKIKASFKDIKDNKKLLKSGFKMVKKSGYSAVFDKKTVSKNLDDISKYDSLDRITTKQLDDEDIKQKAINFKDEYFLDLELSFFHIQAYKDMKIARFVQTQYDSIILDGFLDIFFVNDEVAYVMLRWYDLELEKEENIDITTPTICYKLLREVTKQRKRDNSEVKITDIKLGYHFFESLEVKQGILLPCYLFFDQKNNCYIVDIM